ncbi:hypothetical protein LLS47_19920 [Rouxiella badensis]|uniref:hypothetical protein n=1 Tax=Rouxiella badensis TaxID=1646377 RepID=UPI0013EEF4D7|nr:hypothetical protein [Rouxiella badensis]MCC3735205.1 hypothetical protein [Rouxiella badensis]MCC3760502.1 hypothetical protein [Rouxiella badensis]QII36182.1 hypothetical protein G3M83_10790 [Rouxiella badensis]
MRLDSGSPAVQQSCSSSTLERRVILHRNQHHLANIAQSAVRWRSGLMATLLGGPWLAILLYKKQH